MGQSRQAYYRSRRREADRLASAQAVVELVREQRTRQPRLGTHKLHHLLQEPLYRQGIALGRDAMFDVLRNARLLVGTPAGVPQDHRQPPTLQAPSEPAQGRAAAGARQQQRASLVADITYLPMHGKFVYLSLVTDAYSRKIVGPHVHKSCRPKRLRRP